MQASLQLRFVSATAAPVRLWSWYLSLSEGRRFVLVIAGAFLVIFARRPERLLQAEFYGEDGSVFYVGTYFGAIPEVLFRPYAGYDNLITRLLAYAERIVPVIWAPLVANLGAILLVAILAAFLASMRMRSVAPHPGLRLGLAGLLICLPNSFETLGIAADVMRYTPMSFLALSLATAPEWRVWRIVDMAGAGIASLSGPAGVLMQPLFWVRAWRLRDRYSISLAGIITLGSLIQVATLISSGRNSANLADPVGLVRAFGLRTTVQALAGQRVTDAASRVGIPLALAAVVACVIAAAFVWLWLRVIPHELRWPVAWTFIAVTGASALAQTEGASLLLGINHANRYFVVPTAMTSLVVAAAYFKLRRGPGRWLALLLATLLCIGIVGDLRMNPFTTYGWASTSGCIGTRDPCDVPVFPPAKWTIHWPGSNGVYVQPRPDA